MKPAFTSASHTFACVTKDQILADLKKIGVRKGDSLAVTLSFKRIGYVKGGPEAFIDALLEAVGPEGTIMMNTHTKGFPLSRVSSNYIFDSKSTPAWTGLVPETLRKRKNSIRSFHPICSVTVIGKMAKYLTGEHDENASLYLPYSRLAKIGGKYLCIGLGNNLVAIRHEPQFLAGLFDIVQMHFGVKYRDKEGNLKLYIYHHPPCIRKLPELVAIAKKMNILNTGKVGGAYSILMPAREFIDTMTSVLRKSPELTLCDSFFCIWCRELEREMNLYKKIQNPRYFQKRAPAIAIIGMINRLRMKEFNFLSFQNGEVNEVIERGKFEFYLGQVKSLLRISYLTTRNFIGATSSISA